MSDVRAAAKLEILNAMHSAIRNAGIGPDGRPSRSQERQARGHAAGKLMALGIHPMTARRESQK